MTGVQELLDRTIAENMMMKDELSRCVKTTYAQKVIIKPSTIPSDATTSKRIQSQNEQCNDVHSDRQTSIRVQLPNSAAPPPQQKAVDQRAKTQHLTKNGVKEDDGQHNGARLKHEQRPVIDMPLLQQALSTLSMDSCATDESNDRRDTQQEDDRDFSFPRREVQRQRQDERRRRKVIQGYARGGNTRLKGAPAPSRDLFIYRVDSDTTVVDVRDFIQNWGHAVRSIQCVSNHNSKYKSFKLTVPASDLDGLFCDTFPWPEGVRVRMFVQPRGYRERRESDYYE